MTEPDTIACWQRIDSRLTTSGRLKAADIARLAAIGVRHVINLALPDSPGALADEDRLMDEAGLDYTHIPVPFDAPDETHFEKFRKAMAETDKPVHVHCILNWRASAFVYRYNRDARAMPEAEARALMARQWTPETSNHKDAPAWVRFIAASDD